MGNKVTRDNLGPPPEQVLRELLGQRDVIGASVLQVLIKIDEELAAGGWDQPSRLFTLRRRMAPPDVLAGMAAGGIHGELLLLEVTEIGDAIFNGCNGAQITHMLNRLAEVGTRDRSTVSRVLQLDSENGGGDLIGWFLVNEGYLSVRADADEPYDPPSEDPRRVEIRFLLCVDIVGTEFYLVHRRDTGTAHLWHNGADTEVTMGGRMSEALRAVVKAMSV